MEPVIGTGTCRMESTGIRTGIESGMDNRTIIGIATERVLYSPMSGCI